MLNKLVKLGLNLNFIKKEKNGENLFLLKFFILASQKFQRLGYRRRLMKIVVKFFINFIDIFLIENWEIFDKIRNDGIFGLEDCESVLN